MQGIKKKVIKSLIRILARLGKLTKWELYDLDFKVYTKYKNVKLSEKDIQNFRNFRKIDVTNQECNYTITLCNNFDYIRNL